MTETLLPRRALPALLALTAIVLTGVFTTAAHADIRVQPVRSFDTLEGDRVPSDRIVVFDDAGACAPGAYTIDIRWGDGTSSPGTVVFTDAILDVHLDPVRCTYQAIGEHAYRSAGTRPLSARICRGAECHETAGGGTARIADAAMRGDGRSFGATTGVAYTGTVARFDDDNHLSQASDFAATIEWGDGTSSPGTVTGADGRFDVAGTHSYATAGRRAVRVTLLEGGVARVVADATASVDDDSSGRSGGSDAGGAAPRVVVAGSGNARPALRLRTRAPRLRSLRRGLPIRVAVGSSVRSLRIELVRVTPGPRVLGTVTVAVSGGRVVGGVRTADLRVRLGRSLLRRVRAGNYALRFRTPGSGTTAAQFRVTR